METLTESTKHLQTDLHYLYEALGIPMYVYRGCELLLTMPEQASFFPPASPYLDVLLKQATSGVYVPTTFSSLFGVLPLPDGDLLVLGPVAQLPYTRQDFHHIFAEYHVKESEQENFVLFFQMIPRHLPRDFGKRLAMIHHFLNPSVELDLELHVEDQVPKDILSTSIQNVYNNISVDQFNNSSQYESVMTDIVEHGRLDAIPAITGIQANINAGTLARTPLRNQKNLQIAEITIITRAAIRGGMEDQLAYQLSDQYIQSIENADSQQTLQALISDAILSFTAQVSAVQKTHIDNADINQILRYIRKRPNEPLTVAAIADTFGYNSSYLSTRFKKELGFSLSSFIYRTKLEEAKQLLLHTNRSLLEISEYLCFHDQSHFQKRFKQQYGMTPMQFRRGGSNRK